MRSVTLVIPSLIWPHEHIPLNDVDTPHLNTLCWWGHLSKHPIARRHLYSRHLWNGSLLERAKAHCSISTDEHAFFASPIHQTIHANQVHFVSDDQLQMQEEEAKEWCAELNDFLGKDGWKFFSFHPTLWVVKAPRELHWKAQSLFDLNHRIQTSDKPIGPHGADILRLSTEVETFLHQHQYNQTRQQHQKVPINGIWFWQDVIGAAAARSFLLTDSSWPCIGIHCVRLDSILWSDVRKNSRHQNASSMVVFTKSLENAVNAQDAERYLNLLHNWDHGWFAPIAKEIRTGKLHQLNLLTAAGSLQVERQWIPPFWRKKPSFQGHW